MQIRKTAFGITIEDIYQTDRGTDKYVSVSVRDSSINTAPEINVAATGDLNRAGIAALKRVLAVAEAIVESGGLIIET